MPFAVRVPRWEPGGQRAPATEEPVAPQQAEAVAAAQMEALDLELVRPASLQPEEQGLAALLRAEESGLVVSPVYLRESPPQGYWWAAPGQLPKRTSRSQECEGRQSVQPREHHHQVGQLTSSDSAAGLGGGLKLSYSSMRVGRLSSVLWLVLACGCENEATVELSSNCFGICLDASAEFDLDAHLAISADLARGLDSARAGLSAYAGTAKALSSFVQAMVDLNPSLPAGLSYEGGGLYTATPNGSTRVEMRFYLASDTSFGTAGDLIAFNLFDVSSYFASFGVKTSTSISLSGISTSTGFTFDGVGPGAELLGIAPTATSPVSVDVGAFSNQLSQVIVAANVIETYESERSRISFALAPARITVGAVGSVPIALTLSEFVGNAPDMEQRLSLGEVDLSAEDAGATFDGTVQFTSASPDFDFDMLFSYDASAKADIVFGCPGSTLQVP